MNHLRKILFAAAASAMLLTGCGGESSQYVQTVIPSIESMESSMKTLGYKTSVLGDYEKDGFVIFSASNGKSPEEYEGVMLMRAKDADDLNEDDAKASSVEDDNIIFWVKRNDPVLDNIFVSGTPDAIRQAGITLGD